MTLEELLGAEQYTQAQEKMAALNEAEPDKKKHVRFVDLSEGGYVSAAKYEAMESERNTLKEQVDSLTDSMAELKKNSKKGSLNVSLNWNDTLQATIDRLTQQLTDVQKQAEAQRKSYAVKEALGKAGVLDADYLLFKLGGVDAFTVSESGEIENTEALLAPLRESMPAFFTKPAGYHPKGGTPPAPENPFAKETRNLTKQGELLRANPVKAHELAKAAGVKLE